jgi:hypothetical protein
VIVSSVKFLAELHGTRLEIFHGKYLDSVMGLSYIPTAFFKGL